MEFSNQQDMEQVGAEEQPRNDDMNGSSQMDSAHPSAPGAAEGDISLACRDCGGMFLFTVGEQEFYAMKGFEGPPTRCKPCHAQKKIARGNAEAGSHQMNYMMMDGYGMPYYGYGVGNGIPRKPCHAFQRGNCMYGADCRYSHDQGPAFPMGYGAGFSMGYGGGMEPQNYGGYGGGPRRHQTRSRNPCFAFQRGSCTYGDSCRYSHDPEVIAGGAPHGHGGGARHLCHAFQSGNCKYGDSCRFVHES